MTHYTQCTYTYYVFMYYILNHVVYELYKVIFSLIAESDTPNPTPFQDVIKSATVECMKCLAFHI